VNLKELFDQALSAKVRLWIYIIVALGSLGVAAWQASNGDWLVFAGLVLTSLVNTLAATHVELPAKSVETFGN
jgi:hypothetical protein